MGPNREASQHGLSALLMCAGVTFGIGNRTLARGRIRGKCFIYLHLKFYYDWNFQSCSLIFKMFWKRRTYKRFGKDQNRQFMPENLHQTADHHPENIDINIAAENAVSKGFHFFRHFFRPLSHFFFFRRVWIILSFIFSILKSQNPRSKKSQAWISLDL